MWNRLAKMNQESIDNINDLGKKQHTTSFDRNSHQALGGGNKIDSILEDSYDIYSRINTRNNRSVKFQAANNIDIRP